MRLLECSADELLILQFSNASDDWEHGWSCSGNLGDSVWMFSFYTTQQHAWRFGVLCCGMPLSAFGVTHLLPILAGLLWFSSGVAMLV